jgi:hypothetical protein
MEKSMIRLWVKSTVQDASLFAKQRGITLSSVKPFHICPDEVAAECQDEFEKNVREWYSEYVEIKSDYPQGTLLFFRIVS